MIKAEKNIMIVTNNDDKTCESVLVKRVLEELKNKKLLKNPKSSYKSTEKMLYSLNVLPEAVRLIDEEIKSLKEEAKSITPPPAKSNTLESNAFKLIRTLLFDILLCPPFAYIFV